MQRERKEASAIQPGPEGRHRLSHLIVSLHHLLNFLTGMYYCSVITPSKCLADLNERTSRKLT